MRRGLNRSLRSARCLARDDSGASLLELSVVAPFLLTLGLGVFEFSNALYQYNMITAGVRDAGRYLAGMPDRDVTTRENGKKLAVYGSLTSTVKRVDWWDISDVSVRYCIDGTQEGDADPDCPCDSTLGLRGGTNKVCVGTAATYDDLGFLNFFGLGPINIATSHEERYFSVR